MRRVIAHVLFGLAAWGLLFAADAPPHGIAFERALERGDTAAMRAALAAHARATSLDDAAELFARTLGAVPRNAAFRARYEQALAAPTLPQRAASRELFVLVPGWWKGSRCRRGSPRSTRTARSRRTPRRSPQRSSGWRPKDAA
jgi:hypothetical protein